MLQRILLIAAIGDSINRSKGHKVLKISIGDIKDMYASSRIKSTWSNTYCRVLRGWRLENDLWIASLVVNHINFGRVFPDMAQISDTGMLTQPHTSHTHITFTYIVIISINLFNYYYLGRKMRATSQRACEGGKRFKETFFTQVVA